MSKRDAPEDRELVVNRDLPFSAMGNNLHIELLGNNRLVLDGEFTIIEYTEENIKLKIKKGFVEIYGIRLVINNINDESLIITGKIILLEFSQSI